MVGAAIISAWSFRDGSDLISTWDEMNATFMNRFEQQFNVYTWSQKINIITMKLEMQYI